GRVAEDFCGRYGDLLPGSYDCVDRIVLNAFFPLGHNPGGFRTWWRRWHDGSDDDLDSTHLMRMAGRFARRVKAWGQANDVPVISRCPGTPRCRRRSSSTATSTSRRRQWRRRPWRRLPADSLLPGQIAVQEARWAASGKNSAGLAPSSEMTPAADSQPMPGTVVSSCHWGRNGSSIVSIWASRAA